MNLNLKEDWIILVIGFLFLVIIILFIVVCVLEIKLLVYELSRDSRVKLYIKRQEKQNKKEREKEKLESEKREKILREQFFMENYNQWIPEEIEFIIPGFRIKKIKPVDY